MNYFLSIGRLVNFTQLQRYWTNCVLQIENLSKSFFNHTALDHVTLTIPEKRIIGILGPNGAGKSTLFKILTGLLRPDSGRIVAPNGWPQMGFKPERLHFPERMTLARYMNFVSNMSGLSAKVQAEEVENLLALVGLSSQAGMRIRDCSKGMRQRLGLAQSLIGDPDVLILDEPTDGLDPVRQNDMHALLQKLRDAGKTIILSSHRLDEVTTVCSDIVILNDGKVLHESSMAEAIQTRRQLGIVVDRPLDDIQPLLESLHDEIVVHGTRVDLQDDALEFRRQILSLVLSAGYDVLYIDRPKASLVDVYKEVTGAS